MKYNYNNLWKLLIDKGLKKKDLMEQANIASSTMAKMGKGQPISLEIIAKICMALDCKIENVVEIIY